MVNFYEAIRANPNYNKLEIGDFLFAEYTCGVTAEKLGFWTDTDYLMHVVTGAKTWHTIDGVCKANPGETLFVKKGASIWEQHFEAEVCLLTFFIPDALVRSTVRLLVLFWSSVDLFVAVSVLTGVPCTLALMSWSFWYPLRRFRRQPELWGAEEPSGATDTSAP
jgi:hypothetical protein